MIILNRCHFLKMAAKVAASTGLIPYLPSFEPTDFDSWMAEEIEKEVVASSSVKILDITASAANQRPVYRGREIEWVPDWDYQHWSVRVNRDGIEEEYAFGFSKNEVKSLLGRQSIGEFVESKLDDTHLISRSNLVMLT